MNTSLLNLKFVRIGARLKITDRVPFHRRRTGLVSLDVRTDRQGEFFEIIVREGADVEVLDLRPRDRHLLLLARENGQKSKYLCGHDERHWFVAGIPESAHVGNVRQAKEALKPPRVRTAQSRHHLDSATANRRKNRAFVRQGEWFFLPARKLVIDDQLVLRNEPLLRGNGGKPHWAEYCYRMGGETVRVSHRFPNGLTMKEYQSFLASHREAHGWRWQTMRRNPKTYVRGRIRHPDHKTIHLDGWHRVLMNTESESWAMRNVAFLD